MNLNPFLKNRRRIGEDYDKKETDFFIAFFVLGILSSELAEIDSYASYSLNLDTLTSEETALFSAHPTKAAKAKLCADKAIESAQSNYKTYTLYKGNGDA